MLIGQEGLDFYLVGAAVGAAAGVVAGAAVAAEALDSFRYVKGSMEHGIKNIQKKFRRA